jgi:hypothetical protein
MLRVGLMFFTMASACGSCGGAQTEPAEGPAEDEAVLGAVEGTVRLADGVEVPARPEASNAAARPPMPEGCTPAAPTDRQPVRLGTRRALSNVLVAAAEFEGEAPPHEAAVHPVAIRDCRLDPPFVAATRGDRVEVTNETDHPFLPRQGAAAFMEMVGRGESRSFELEQGGVTTIDCGFGTDCGRTDVVVLYHPVHTTTSADGRFRLDNVPPGESVEIHAWHPLFEEASATVAVVAGETARVDLVLTPAPPTPVPASPAPAPGEPEGAAAGEEPELF